MDGLPPTLVKVIESFTRFPGIWKKTAHRLCLHVLKSHSNDIEKFAQALGVSPEELLFAAGPTEEPSLALEDAELLHLFREVAGLPESDRAAIKRILSIVVKQNRLQQMLAS